MLNLHTRNQGYRDYEGQLRDSNPYILGSTKDVNIIGEFVEKTGLIIAGIHRRDWSRMMDDEGEHK